MVTEPEPFDFVGVYVPANPFNSLANGVVPAVVLFCVLLGAALIGAENRERRLDWVGVYDYWILGKNAQARGPRWSIARTVLGWVA